MVNKKFIHLAAIFTCSIIMLMSCSNQKNTVASRWFHNLNAHYNVLFNGQESFKKGLKRGETNYKENYSRTLPIFTYGDKDVAKSITSEMDVAIKKAGKLITMHSIKAKPKQKKGQQTAQDKEFYNKTEYNKWVDDAYLLIGKANFYKHEFPAAADAFNLVNREFPKEESHYIALIWLTRIASETGEYKDAERIITALQADKKFPKNQKMDLYSTIADVALKQSNFELTIKNLNLALPLVDQRKTKLRYMYILAQLYQQTGKLKDAELMYTKIIHKNPSYEMNFNARINLAASVEGGSKNAEFVSQKLKKMLKDERNIDFQDQIYYALGNIELKDKQEKQAIEYYQKSVKVSTINTNQKGLSCITLADIYYDKNNFIPAQAYYDSALLNINETYPNFNQIKTKSQSLNLLVGNLNTISREDSLQRVALMPEAERLKFIETLISNVQRKEAEAKLAETQRLQEYYSNQQHSANVGDVGGQGKWVFYNPLTVSSGMRDFQLKWGKRRLEDNWRRKNKGMAAFGSDSPESASSDKKSDQEKKKKLDNKSVEFYMQDLPLTDSLMVASKQKVLDAYYNGGQVYKNELKDLALATALYEQFLKKFPDNNYKLPVYFQLFNMYTTLQQADKAAYYKNLLISSYPESMYTKMLLDPNYYKQLLEKSKEVDRYYESTYTLYNTGQYAQVIDNSNSAYTKFAKDPLLAKFAFIKALAVGKTSDPMVFRTELNTVITTFPKDEVSVRAKEIIAFLNSYKPETKVQDDIKAAEVTYINVETPPFYCAIVVDKKEDINQIVFDLINFNLDNFTNDHLEINNEEMGKTQKIIFIKSFPTKEKGIAYYKTLVAKSETLKNIKGISKTLFLITPANMLLLEKESSPDSYFQFFKKHFL